MNAQPHATDVDTSTLRQYREAAGYSRPEVAKAVNEIVGGHSVTGDMVGHWERGRKPSHIYRRALARVYGVTVTDLGIAERRPAPRQTFVPRRELQTTFMETAPDVDPRVQQSQQSWIDTRAALNANRLPLAKLAAGVYPPQNVMPGTGLIFGDGWIPDTPVSLDQVTLSLDEHAPRPALDGSEPESQHVRPCSTLTRAYPRYTMAVRDLAPPKLFANRAAWRFTGLDWATASLTFAPTFYFAAVDVNEVVAHEMAMVAVRDGIPAGQPPSWRDLPYRRHVGDPFDFTRRPVMPAISTLTVRGGDHPEFILHRRDSKSVAMAGGTLQVIPSGIFQPSSVLPEAAAQDFSLWSNVIREYAEELLGYDEHDGDGRPVDYTAEPFATMNAARDAGQMRLWVLGCGLDALTLVGEILTVAVIDPDVFDTLARDFVEVNEEGTVVGERQPFTQQGVEGLLASGRMAPAGAGCLALAWQHRDVLDLT